MLAAGVPRCYMESAGVSTRLSAAGGARTGGDLHHQRPAGEWAIMKLIARLNLKYLVISAFISFVLLVCLLPQTSRLPSQIGKRFHS